MKPTVLSVLIAVALVFAGGAGETPADEGYQGRYTPPPSVPVYHNPAPVWHRLAQMSPAERANAMIDLEREEPLARDIEHLWNTGHYERALELLTELAPEEMGISWREPIRTPGTDWDVPVPVSNRDSVLKVKLAADATTGNLFCAFHFLGDGQTNHWVLCYSTNGGQSWSETATWFAGYLIPDIALTIVSGHAYVGYIRTNVNQAATRRYRVTNGTSESFPSGSLFFTLGGVASPDTLRELALTSNTTEYDNRLYAFFNTKGSQSRYHNFSSPAFSDTWVTTGMPTNVARGLDAVWNHESPGQRRVFSYISTSGSVAMYRINSSNVVSPIYAAAMPSNGSYTSLAAWKDTLHVVFDQQRTSTTQAWYLVQYDSGGTVYQGWIGDTIAGFSRNAAATGERGDGVGVTYWQYPQSNPGQCFRSRPGYRGNWTPAVSIQQGLTTASDRVPAIARVAPGVHGVVFTRGFNYGMAYFNRSDWPTGIAGPELAPVGPGTRPVAIIRGMLELRPTETGELFDASGRRLMTLAGGTNDLRHLAPGVYFLGIEEGGASYRQKLILAE